MTYMRLVQFTLSPSSSSRAQAIGDDLIPAIKQQPGCISAAVFGGNADGKCWLAVHWQTQENAEAASAIIGPRLQQHLEGNVVGPADIRLLPVLVS